MNVKTRERVTGNLLGIFWIVLGVIIAGNVLDWWHVSIFFRGWWTLFIIIPCAYNVMKKGFQSGAGFGLVVGILLFFSQRSSFSIGWIIKLFIPVMLIIFGAKIILQGASFRRKTMNHIPDDLIEDASCSGIFQNREMQYEDSFFGSEVNAIFGAADLDLRSAIIDEDVVINATAVFGGVTIKLPEDVNVRVTSTSILGGTDNRIKRPENPDWPTVNIRATAIFGGIDIL